VRTQSAERGHSLLTMYRFNSLYFSAYMHDKHFGSRKPLILKI